jgi:RimJ/RimL family protein N-acetyltransferase
VRPPTPGDADHILLLADRLQEGVAPWRDQDAVRDAVRGWVRDAIGRIGDPDSALLVAEDDAGTLIGFVGVSERDHFTGETDTSIGELVVAPAAERQGAGRALVDAAMAWGRDPGRRRVVVDTGAANTAARRFYAALGFADEDVTLGRAID